MHQRLQQTKRGQYDQFEAAVALQPSRLVLCGRKLSSCTARVRIAAHFKNIPLDFVECRAEFGARNLYQDSISLKKNPNATVPTLEAHYGIGESLVSLSMLEFLEDPIPGICVLHLL